MPATTASSTSRPTDAPRPGDIVTTIVTGTAPHYLIADAAPLDVRRTRAGDAWAARRAAPAPGGEPGPGSRPSRHARPALSLRVPRTARPGTVVAVVGATATGKSDLAIDLALRLDGEVVNVDSMQLYRGMDIGTAKLPLAERRGVPHHLLDIWEVTQTASVAEYQRITSEVIDDIVARGKVPGAGRRLGPVRPRGAW